MTNPDPDLVREFMVIVGLRKPGDKSEILPPEVRYFKKRYPAYLERKRREAEERARWERMWAEAAEARERAAHQIWLKRDMRKWGRENGFFVGTRGRIPRKVINAYNEAKGIK